MQELCLIWNYNYLLFWWIEDGEGYDSTANLKLVMLINYFPLCCKSVLTTCVRFERIFVITCKPLISHKFCSLWIRLFAVQEGTKKWKIIAGKIFGSCRLVKWLWRVKLWVLPHYKANTLLEVYREIYLDFAVIILSQQELCFQAAACLMQRWDAFLGGRK